MYIYIYICIHTHTAIYNNDNNNNNICIYTNIDRSNQSCHFYHVIVKVVVPWRIHQRLSFWAALPLDVHGLPSGKHTKSYGKSPCLMVKSTRQMAMFNSQVKLPEGIFSGSMFIYQRASSINWKSWRKQDRTTILEIQLSASFFGGVDCTLWSTNSLLLKMAMEILDFPMKNGDFPQFLVCLPEGSLTPGPPKSQICLQVSDRSAFAGELGFPRFWA